MDSFLQNVKTFLEEYVFNMECLLSNDTLLF